MFEENWAYRIMVILSLCIMLVWTYLTNEETLLNYISGKFILDTRLIWQIGIFAILSIVLFYLMQSTLDYKVQNEVLKEYQHRLQGELDAEREALKEIKSESSGEMLRLESFIVTISDMAKQISSVLETEDLLRLILRKTIDLLGVEKCAIFRFDNDKKELVYVDSAGYHRSELERLILRPGEEFGLLGLSLKTQEFVSRKLISEDSTKQYVLDNDKFQVGFCQPIIHNAKILAMICIADVKEGLTDRHVARLVSTLANFGAVALTNTELVDRIREQSKRDSLTWLYNHQYFQDRMEALLNHAIDNKEPLGIFIMDIDHFKQFNDTYGHQTGDFVLKKTAEILIAELTENDLTARLGGEEFAAALPLNDEKKTYEIGERLRKRFESSKFEFGCNELKITVSIGISAFNPSKPDAVKKSLLIKYADDALYRAKREGRNKVIMHS